MNNNNNNFTSNNQNKKDYNITINEFKEENLSSNNIESEIPKKKFSSDYVFEINLQKKNNLLFKS
jgi:hypothetical protein